MKNIETKIVNSKLGKDFPLPSYATNGSAGMDIRACIEEPITIQPRETKLIPSGLAIHIQDPSIMAILTSRSGLGIRHRMCVAQGIGVVDSDYEGEIGIGLSNLGSAPYTVQPGERICQMIFVPVLQAELTIVDDFSHLSNRGSGGFGSTGRH